MQWEAPKVYAVKHKDINVRMNSRSGGIFTAVSDEILNKAGVIYGCILTDSFEAEHYRATSFEDRDKMRGSKYIQSNIGDMFKAVAEDLNADRWVLFSGTSCQIAGLKAFLKTDYEKLVCVDIVCHGVPSLMVWKEYLKWQEKKNHGKCVKVDFRNKRDFGWNSHIETLTIENKGKIKIINSGVFRTLFYDHNILRPSCYKCPYKSIMHPADITIADYWGIEKAAPGFDDNKGVSLVLINNDKGLKLWNAVSGEVQFKECRIEDSIQPPLKGSFKVPYNRSAFWEDFYQLSFDKIAVKYAKAGFKDKLKARLKNIKKRFK